MGLPFARFKIILKADGQEETASSAHDPESEYLQNHGLIWYDDTHGNASIFEHMIRVDQGEVAAIASVPQPIMEACAAAVEALR